jgi:hypothetical protein
MNARPLILALGAVLLIAGLIGLLMPVSVSDGVGCGVPISGGDTSAARQRDQSNLGNSVITDIPVVGPAVQSISPPTHYEADCNSALGTRLVWSIPLAVIGLIGIGGAFLIRSRSPGVRSAHG